jgi:crotonobetainyl-CoA:carnitine CoA-transferase CaiB-like acyl-CoA transferase
MGASMFGAIAIQAALLEREKSGEGQWIDVAMLDSQVAFCENSIARYCATGEIPRPQGSRHPLATPFQIFFHKGWSYRPPRFQGRSLGAILQGVREGGIDQ